MRLSGLAVRFGLWFLIFVVCAIAQPISQATAEDRIHFRSKSPFETPPQLRARVDFWKDVFTRYGKFDLIVHHRMFPQAVFHVERLEYIVEAMSPADQERFVTFQEAALKRDVAEVLRFLERGGRPFSRFEQEDRKSLVERYKMILFGCSEVFGNGIRRRFVERVDIFHILRIFFTVKDYRSNLLVYPLLNLPLITKQPAPLVLLVSGSL
jgi:hypothetical protein